MTAIQVPETKRLKFRLMDGSDTDLMWQLDQDEEVMRYINGGKKTTRDDINNTMLPRYLSYHSAENGWGMWHVSSRADGAFLGFILIRPMYFFSDERDDSNLEVGWRFHRKYWGKGYATEAAHAVMNALHLQIGITHFSAIAVTENRASINIMKKLGMHFQKRDLFNDPLITTEVDYYSIAGFTANS